MKIEQLKNLIKHALDEGIDNDILLFLMSSFKEQVEKHNLMVQSYNLHQYNLSDMSKDILQSCIADIRTIDFNNERFVDRVSAIKEIRDFSGCGLKDAKIIVDALVDWGFK